MPYPSRTKLMRLLRDHRAFITAQRFPECYLGSGTDSTFIGFEKLNYLWSDQQLRELAILLTGVRYRATVFFANTMIGNTQASAGHSHAYSITGVNISGVVMSAGGTFDERALYDLHATFSAQQASRYSTLSSRVLSMTSWGILAGPSPGTIVPA